MVASPARSVGPVGGACRLVCYKLQVTPGPGRHILEDSTVPVWPGGLPCICVFVYFCKCVTTNNYIFANNNDE